jgi:hypothetical protein
MTDTAPDAHIDTPFPTDPPSANEEKPTTEAVDDHAAPADTEPAAPGVAKFDVHTMPDFSAPSIAAIKYSTGIEDTAEAVDLLSQKCLLITNVYSKNGSIAYWTPELVTALECVLVHNMCNRLDSEAAIEDLRYYELVFSKLRAWLTSLVATTSVIAFEAAQATFLDVLTQQSLTRLQNALATSLRLMNERPTERDIIDGDTASLWADVQAAEATELAPGYAKVRFMATMEKLEGRLKQMSNVAALTTPETETTEK